jgi:choline-sulfatase
MSRSNVLLLFTDMQRADTIHALGNPIIKTPNLDRLVREGTAFSNAFSPSPVCVPARCSMHYGLYPQKTGLCDNGRMPEDNGSSLPALLGRHGYKTAAIGKCHFTPDKVAMRGFDSRLMQEECCSDSETDDYCAWLKAHGYDYDEPHGTRGEMYYIPQISLHKEEDHPSTWVGDRCVEFIEANRDSEQPWFLFSSFIHPHPPFAPPKPWHKLYRSPDMPLPYVPEDSAELHTWINRRQNRYKYRDRGIDRQLMRNIKAYYYATISFVDYQVGKILDALEESGELDNTMILFTSDHGEYLGDYNCFGKRSMHDASSRIPFIVRHPERFEANVICDKPVSLVDVLPTITSFAGCETDDVELDGVDLVKLVNGDCDRSYVFSQFQSGPTGIYMIASREWKYFHSAGENKDYLFDRLNDPLESNNLAGDVAHEQIKNELKLALLTYLQSSGEAGAVDGSNGAPEWKQYPQIDESYLEDPDAGLIVQDHDVLVLDKPDYT